MGIIGKRFSATTCDGQPKQTHIDCLLDFVDSNFGGIQSQSLVSEIKSGIVEGIEIVNGEITVRYISGDKDPYT